MTLVEAQTRLAEIEWEIKFKQNEIKLAKSEIEVLVVEKEKIIQELSDTKDILDTILT